MKVKFQADHDLDRSIVRGLLRRQPAINFRYSPLPGMEDVGVLGFAAHEGRILVSHDISTMPVAFARFSLNSRSLPQRWPLMPTIEHLLLIWELTDASEWEQRICYLPTLADFIA